MRESNVSTTFTYYHVELDDHSLILAENAPAETFIDYIDRMAFDNWEEHQALDDAGPIAEMNIPRAQSARQVPTALGKKIADRAAVLFGNGTAAKAA